VISEWKNVHRNTVVLLLYETFRTTLPSAARPPAMRDYLINEISGAALSPIHAAIGWATFRLPSQHTAWLVQLATYQTARYSSDHGSKWLPRTGLGKSSESVQCAMLKACNACTDMGQLYIYIGTITGPCLCMHYRPSA